MHLGANIMSKALYVDHCATYLSTVARGEREAVVGGEHGFPTSRRGGLRVFEYDGVGRPHELLTAQAHCTTFVLLCSLTVGCHFLRRINHMCIHTDSKANRARHDEQTLTRWL